VEAYFAGNEEKSDMEDIYRPIESWCFEPAVTNFNLFKDRGTFNADIHGWDTSHVTAMFGMFWGASTFNQPIGNWNVSSVSSMGGMSCL
jgi:hypothetical protein